MTLTLDAAFRRGITLAEFTWGPPDDDELFSKRYADVEVDVPAFGQLFEGEPTMAVTVPKLTIGVDTEECTVDVPLVASSFTSRISDGLPHPDVKLRLMQLTGDPTAPGVLHLFGGYVWTATRNPGGRSSRVRLSAVSAHQDLEDKNLGVSCNAQCAHKFMGTGCYVQKVGVSPSKSVVDVVTSLSGAKVSLANTGNQIASRSPTFWNAGFMQLGGLRIGVRSWNSGTADFVLHDQPPDEWLLQQVTLVAGCERTITKCRFWANEANFGGYAFNSPSYNPFYELP